MSDGPPLPTPLPARPAPALSWLDRADAVAAAVGVSRVRLLLGAAAVAAALVGVVGFTLSHSLTAAPRQPVEASLPRASTIPGAARAPASTEPVVVAAAGAVVHSGVYKLPAGSRVVNVIDAAGGTTPDADLDRVNLAAKVADGERVYVPRRGEVVDADVVSPGGSAAAAATAAVVDLNTATAEQLESLPGVGPATAKAIVDYRTQHGRFRSVDELLEVRGIGDSKLAQLRPHVRVS